MAKAAKQIQTITDLTPDSANVNKGTERGHYVIDWSLTELGAGRSILADADGVVIAGNKTLECAADHQLPVRVVQTDGKELVVVQRTDLRLQGSGAEREKARQLAIADNRASEVGYSADVEILLSHAQSGIDITPMYREEEIDSLLASLMPEEVKPGNGGDEFDATPEETQTRVKYGDLWQLGEHRVLCGDSTKAEDVARAMGGEKADMCFTDPPYNVAYGSNHNPRHKIRSIQNDALGEDFTPFITKALAHVLGETTGAVYICMSDKEWARMFTILEGLNAHWSSTIVWVKDRLVLSPKDYHSRHELIWYGWREGGRRLPLEDRTKTDVWEIARPSRSDEHPTMKPVELVEQAVGNSSGVGDSVYEPFGGSGSTLIACERTNRKARVIEIEPKYVNVILSRYEAETGKQAKLLERLDG